MIIFMILIVAGVIVVIAIPAVRRRPQAGTVLDDSEGPRALLLRKKESSYAAIQELNFDYQTGKISEEDYSEVYSALKADALSAIKAIEEGESEYRRKLDEELEEEISEKRGIETKPYHENDDEAGICPACGGQNLKYCHECGNPVDAGAAFCSNCGTPLSEAGRMKS
jgi:hypothetical protein